MPMDSISVVIDIQIDSTVRCLAQSSSALAGLLSIGMDECISMSISGDSLLDETLNRGPWCCSCGNSMNYPLGLIQC